jgi:hypothetical protein
MAHSLMSGGLVVSGPTPINAPAGRNPDIQAERECENNRKSFLFMALRHEIPVSYTHLTLPTN